MGLEELYEMQSVCFAPIEATLLVGIVGRIVLHNREARLRTGEAHARALRDRAAEARDRRRHAQTLEPRTSKRFVTDFTQALIEAHLRESTTAHERFLVDLHEAIRARKRREARAGEGERANRFDTLRDCDALESLRARKRLLADQATARKHFTGRNGTREREKHGAIG